MALSLKAAFADRPIKEQLDYFQKLCDSQNTALDKMQQERNEWMRKAKSWEIAVEKAQEAFDIQKDIVSNLVTKTNAASQETNNRIRDLERKVSELGGDIG